MKKNGKFPFILFFLILLCSYCGLYAADYQPSLSGGGGLSFTVSNYNGFNVSCNGAADGSIDLTPSGTAPFTYIWSNGATTEDLSGITAGTYTVTVTDNIGTVLTDFVTLTEPAVITISPLSVQDVSCNGGSNGAISVDVTGGTPGYTFLWSNGAVSQNISGVAAGTYTVTVTDLNNCTAQFSQAISEPSAIAITPISIQNVSCNGGNNGSVNIDVNGGTPGYSFLWSNGAGTQNISGLAAGTYTVTVTDLNNCTAQFSQSISEPPAIVITPLSIQNVSCNGGNNGAVSIDVSGGTPGYTFLWSNGAGTQNISGLNAGTYTVTVTDLNNCTAQFSQSISEPPAIVITPLSIQNVSCNGGNNGAISIDVTGGAPAYSFLWSNGAGTQNISGLSAGTYTVTVTDLNNCTSQFTQTLTEPSALSATTSTTSPNCNSNNGTATVIPSGGTPGYSYLWSTGSANQTANGLGVGTYTVTVTDLNNCTFQTTAQVNSAIGPSISNAVVTDVSCNGSTNGSVNITITGGTGAITFLWSNGAVTEDISGLSPGVYTVTVTDQSNCDATGNYTVNAPSAITIAFNSTSPGCILANGSITANPSGGAPGYIYLWSNGQNTQTISNLAAGTYTVTVTDANSCTGTNSFTLNASSAPVITLNSITPVSCNGGNNGAVDIAVSGGTVPLLFQWSNGAVTEDLSNVPAGTYTVTVTDVLLCSSTATYTITQPSPFAITPSVTPASCGTANGTASVSVTGDTPPYTYLWSTGSTISAISGLGGGNYTVTLTGNTGCTAVQTVTVPSGSALVGILDSVNNVNCISGGAIYISVSGSVAPYQYAWNDGAVTEDRTGLSAGTYTVTVTGNDGCTFSLSATVNAAPTITLSFTSVPAGCGQANGSATVSVLSGTAPFSYLWSNGTAAPSITNVVAGIYSVTVTAGDGCTATDSVTILNAGAPTVNLLSQVFPACDGSPTGSLVINASGGQPPYNYQWSNGANSNNNNNLTFGTYTVTVTDAANCSVTASYSMGTQLQVDPPVVTDNSCAGGSTGAIGITATGGSLPYTYLWSNGQTTQAISNLTSGTYTVTVSDANACTVSASATVSEPAALVLQATVTDVTCSGTGGSVSLIVNGGVGPYSYLWSNGQITPSITGLAAGVYSVTVTDNNACTAQGTYTVNAASTLAAQFQLIQPVSCFGNSDASLSVTASGGVFPYTYLWSTGSSSQLLQNVPAGIYTVTVTDDSGCQSVFSDTIEQPELISLTYNITDPSCGLTNGIISVQASGGTQPYTYLWSNGTAASTISNIAAGVYTLTITDANNCQKDTVFTLVNTGSIQITSVVDSISCNSAADGAIDLTITGGAAPYLFTWINTTQTTEDVSGLDAGNYSVIVTDQSGCTATQSFTLNQPAPINITFPLLQNAACGNSNGGVIAAATGSFGPFTYLWSTGVQNPGLFNIGAGSYTVTATDTKGCTQTSVANISNNTGPVFNSVDSGNVTCYGGANGFINITVGGSSPPFTYSWTGTTATTPSISNLTAGTYTLTATDAQNCISVRSVTITQPDSIRINPVIPQENPPYNLSCFGVNDGSILLSLNGGVPPYTYLWSNGATTQNVQSLPAGVFTVVVTDQQGCTATGTYTLTQPPQLTAIAGQDVTICGTTSYVLQATVPLYGFGFWTAVTYPGINVFSDSTSANATVSNLQDGDNVFLWTVTDSKCSTSVQVTITRGSNIEAIAGTDLVICESTVTLSATNPQFGFGYWRTFTGGVSIDNPSSAVTGVQNLQLGNNIFLWTVISGSCRDSSEINIFRRDSLDCLSIIRLPTAISPNNDGANDVLVIKGLDDFPDNSITIFNRWGVIVYERDNYRNDWDGTGSDGNPVTDGTYFVILKVRSADKVYKTFLDLRR